MYFRQFPVIFYPVDIGGVKQYVQLKDITVNVRFVKEFISNITLYDEYDIVDGETPEIISEKVYGTPFYHWVIMLINEKYDYVKDFPLPYAELIKYVKDKYGEDSVYGTHHYETLKVVSNSGKKVLDAGLVVNEGFTFTFDGVTYSSAQCVASVTNLEYEERMNEAKRRVKLVDRRIIERIASDFVKAIT